MNDHHPAEKAFDEVLDELASEYNTLIEAREAAARMRDRWIEVTGAADDPTRNVSVPNEYVDDSTL